MERDYDRQRALKSKQASNLFIQKLFKDHNTGLLKFLTRKLSDPQEAEDVAQTAYEKMIGVNEAENLENVKSYLYQTALNLAIDRMRRQQRGNHYHQQMKDMMEQTDDYHCPSPERLLSSRQELKHINLALKELPDSCQRAFLMHRTQHLSYREISEALEVSVSMVEKHIIHALKHLRKKLK